MVNRFSAKIIDKLIVLSICALFILPFMIPYSYFPVSKFYSEMITLILALLVGVLCIYKAPRLSISSAGIASFLFALFLLLQIGVLPIRFPGINIFVAIELAIGGLMSLGLVSLVNGEEEKQQNIVLVITWAALISVTIQAFYGILQFTGAAENYKNFILFVGTDGSQVFGNVGQKNDYVDLITVGLFALSYLYFIRQINLIVFSIYAFFFGTILTITTSRTPFSFFILAFIAAVIFWWINRKNTERKLQIRQVFVIVGVLFIGLIILEAFLPKVLEILTGRDLTSGLYRFGGDNIGQSTYRRFYEWYKDLVIFTQHPFFGIGWYQYIREAIYLMNTDRFMYIPANTALYTHSHNSPLNILAETGIIGFAISMLFGFLYSLYRMFKNFNNYATLFIVFMALTIFGQSLFQYPLWYSYFLMFFILFLSVDKPMFSIANTKLTRAIVTFIFVGFLGFCGLNYQTYIQLTSYAQVPQDTDDYANNLRQIQKIVDTNALWSLTALTVMDNYLMPSSPQTNAAMPVQEQMHYIDMLGNELPYTGAIFKQIIIHKEAGDNKGALAYANLIAHAYPYYKDKIAEQLQASPAFADEVAAINNFHYQDRSIFGKKFHKEGDLQ